MTHAERLHTDSRLLRTFSPLLATLARHFRTRFHTLATHPSACSPILQHR
jgi:hypothetical protein